MLGRIFENLLEDNKDKGAFYTPKEIVNYMCRESIIAYLQNDKFTPEGNDRIRHFVETYDGEGLSVDQRVYLKDKLKAVKICDPAIGSGAFPMGLVNLLAKLYSALRISTEAAVIKRHIMEQSIYGVDIEQGAVDIARLRFWLAMIVEEKEPMPLPNLHFKIMQGNSLLESYKGIDLSDLTKVKTQRGLFDSDDFERESLAASLREYYKTSDHAKRDRLFTEIINNVRRQLYAKQITLPTGEDPSANSDFFLWHTWFSDVLDKGGFDIVIGNPPYIQLQNSTGNSFLNSKGKLVEEKLGDLYAKTNFKSFEKRGDIYCLFYEIGINLLKSKGILCYITSNKWLKAGYGESLRDLLASLTNPQILIDFGGVKIFENAIVDTNILLLSKSPNQGSTISVKSKKEDTKRIENLADFVEKNGSVSAYLSSDTWFLLSPIEKEIQSKFIEHGKELQDWNITINYGVKTGLNDVFIINEDIRNTILSCCKDDEEIERTNKIILPILRGRDIKRYGYEWPHLWCIMAYYGSYKTMETSYPAIFSYLSAHELDLRARGQVRYTSSGKEREGDFPGQHHWLELDNNPSHTYINEFSKPKIVWAELSRTGNSFTIDLEGHALSNTGYILTIPDNNLQKLHYLTAFLNSRIILYMIDQITTRFDDNGWRWLKQFVDKIRIPDYHNLEEFSDLVSNCTRNNQSEISEKINTLVAKSFNLTEEEVRFINNKFKGY